MKSLNFINYLQVFVLGVHFEFWGVFSFWVFGVWRNEWYHKSGRSRFIPVRVRIQRARASNFDFELVFEFFVFWIFCYKSFCTPRFYGVCTPHEIFQFHCFFIGFAQCVHFEFWGMFSFWVFDVWRNEWYHKSGRSRFIPVRVRIQRARASKFDFGLIFGFFHFLTFCTPAL